MGLTRLARRLVDRSGGPAAPIVPYDPSRHGPLVEDPGPADAERVERYWVDRPYARVSIDRDPAGHDLRYRVVEPRLGDQDAELLEALRTDLRTAIVFREAARGSDDASILDAALREQLVEYGVSAEARRFHALRYYLERDFLWFGPLTPLLRDPNVEDVSCDGYGAPLFVYHSEYADVRTDLTFERAALDDLVVRLAQRAGRSISVAEPIANAMLPDGSRAELALGETVTPRGSAFTIRKYGERPMTPVALIDEGTFAPAHMAYFWLAIEHNRSLLFAGGTASGKTTSLNAVSMFIPPRSKVVTIEDTQEVRLDHENWLPAVTRESVGEGTDVDMYRLLRSALRHRPEYLVVGEIRGAEAMTLFQAMNTGHTTYSTMHADSLRTAINRLANEPLSIPPTMIESLDVLSVQTLSHRAGDRLRRTRTVAEIDGIDRRSGTIDARTVIDWRPAEDDFRVALSRSDLLARIAEERGWSMVSMRSELRNRKRVLRYARDRGITDYRTFTDLITDYYDDPDGVLSRVEPRSDRPRREA